MTRPALFHESLNEAVREVALVYGDGKMKRAGALLWPEISPEAAGSRLGDCLNPDRRDVLRPEQLHLLMKIGREIGSHAIANFLMRESGYADPLPIEPEDERARLQRDFIEAARAVSGIAERLARHGIKVAA